ncbi:U-scoloptoxin(01)-Cw1a-like [Panulirus ornatus]|uniref:U-scoloptoxin(01)-Cw1a-like n=1 Tax=Panulirus ornatus TaxID=150431 RepID=UPI003A862971
MARLVLAILLTTVAVATARMAYVFPDGVQAIFGLRDVKTLFSCADRPYGYYADMENDCQFFHLCYPLADETGNVFETAHFSFMCGNKTVFNQESLTCTFPEEAYPCQESSFIYDISNSQFGVIPERI